MTIPKQLGAMLDIQNSPDTRGIALCKTGIKDYQHPLQVLQADGRIQHTIAKFDLAVGLSAELRGTHMSRFIEIINNIQSPLHFNNLSVITNQILNRLQAKQAYLSIQFPFFMQKEAPVSKSLSSMDYAVNWQVESINGRLKVFLNLRVPVTSLCPCSKAISKYGAHNQRSIVNLNCELTEQVWPEDLIEMIESESSCELYGILKRNDEKYITEKAYENPKFVEDMVRDIVIQCDSLKLKNYNIAVENLESIHNHSAYAYYSKD